MRNPDVLIIGGGVIGCAVAYHLTCRSSLRVVLLEREALGSGATNAAAGVLAVSSSRAPRGVLFELRRRSAAMFPVLATALRSESGIDPEYVQRGLLELAFTPRDESALRELVRRRREQGFRAEMLDAPQARAEEPSIAPGVRAAAVFADDHSINNQRFVAALAEATRRRGADLRPGTPATAVESGGNRVLRVRAGDGDWLNPAVVVIAAGVWSPELGALLRVRIPVRPVRGEMAALRPPALPRRTVAWQDGYLVPRPDGELLVGSTSEYGDSIAVTDKGLATLLRRAGQMIPALRGATPTRTWAGLRPCPTIRRPIIGPVRGFDNLILATGHHRNGILLAPITGQLVAELITDRVTSVPLQPFCYRPR